MNTAAKPDDYLNDQASAWLARLSAEDASESDWLDLETWLAADPAHLAAYARVEALWAELGDQAPGIAPHLAPDGDQTGVIDFTARRNRRPQPRWIAPAVGVAAVLAVVVFAGLPMYAGRTVTYQTAPGETRQIALADGTTIHMNGASKMSVKLTARQRTVRMAEGEASFEVAHNAARPFVVRVGEVRVRDIGTEFNIRRDSDSTTVSVRKGVVEVAPVAGGAPATRLTPGRQLVDPDGPAAADVHEIAPDQPFAWQVGQLIYTGQDLSSVAEDLSRRFTTPIHVDGAAASLPFSGVLVLDDEDSVIRRLESFLPVTDHRTTGAITLTDRR